MSEEIKIRKYTPHTKKECRNVAKRIIELQKENQQLKEQLDKAIKQSVTDHKYASECEDKVITYKSVLDEIREQLKKIKPDLDFEPWSIYTINGDKLFDLLQILDKVKE